ncbi:fungal chitosanase of glycosyl hydrolase group 75-domain-containing protein [Mycena filopes]|nr:fungal chitosanase of glycosyl hydrolase group 75-domain-containing protein [Mycena filopes]
MPAPSFFVSACLVALAVAAPLSSPRLAARDDLTANILKAAAGATASPLATFPSNAASAPNVQIFGDWLSLKGVSAFHFTADMDVDCDGVAGCSDDPSGQPQTLFGHLDSSQVPYFVLPASFVHDHGDIVQPNAVGAILCGDKLVYGIFGDTNGATPEVIGEASLLLANTCFPNDALSGGNGHSPLDVLYVVFGNAPAPNVGDQTISIADLQKVGDEQVALLRAALGF